MLICLRISVMNSQNSFDRIVSGISKDERKSLLKKMKSLDMSSADSSADIEMANNPQSAAVGGFIDDESLDLETSLKKTSPLFRFWLWLKALFTNDTVQNLYNNELVNGMARSLSRNYPGLLDYKHGYLLSTFYTKLGELKICADFFRPYMEYVQEDEGSFLVLLGSLIMPSIESYMETEVDPYTMPFDRPVTSELRTSLIHKMEELIKDLPPKERSIMYASARAIDWLKQFVKLPFDDFLKHFSTVIDGSYTCFFSDVDTDFTAFAKVLVRGRKVPKAVLEALYMFSIRNDSGDELDKDEENSTANEFISKATSQLSMMDMFISTVPLHQIGCVVYNNARWSVDELSGGENWFVKYKAQWKKIFDSRWESWIRDCKKEKLRGRLQEYFDLVSFPLFPERPWADIWGGLSFRYEFTLGFLNSLYDKIIDAHILPLKIVMLEGQFRQKANQVDFTDQVNELSSIKQDLETIKNRLSIEGDFGLIFAKYRGGHLRTNSAQMQIQNVMSELEEIVSEIIKKFGNACRVIDAIIAGIFGQRMDTRYDTLVNLTVIHGRENVEFRKNLETSQLVLNHALEMLSEIEAIDVPIYEK